MDHHMKKILLSSVALLGLSSVAFAADLPSRRVAPAPYVAAPVFTWTGFYVGVNAGYGFHNGNDDRNSLGGFDTFSAPGFGTLTTTDLGVAGTGNNNSRDGF